MAVLPFGDNTRIEVTIYPWALSGTNGEVLTQPISGIWFTKLTPFYSHLLSLEAIFGRLISGTPEALIKMAIWESSRWADSISTPPCANPNLEYFGNIRRRYVTLMSGLSLLLSENGVNPVTKKMLGDFEIEFDTDMSSGIIPKIKEELKKLEPLVQAGGCLGIGTSQQPLGAVRGANDPYRPIMERGWISPSAGGDPTMNGMLTPGYNSTNPRFPDKWSRAGRPYINPSSRRK